MTPPFESSPYRSNLRQLISGHLPNFVRSQQTSVGRVLIKELIQNADDAGASELVVILDHRQGTGLSAPGIVIANDGAFEEKHFRAITEVASGQKLEERAATGRFGVGFTSIYLVGDWCMLRSKHSSFVDRIILFDLAHMVIGGVRDFISPGTDIRTDDAIGTLDANREAVDKWPEKFATLVQHVFLSNVIPARLSTDSAVLRQLASHLFEGIAAFRVPFRQLRHESGELYTARYESPEARATLLQEMISEAGRSLVFLRQLTTIRFAEISDAGEYRERRVISITPWEHAATKYHSKLAATATDGWVQLQPTPRTLSADGIDFVSYLVTARAWLGSPDGKSASDPVAQKFEALRADNLSWRKATPEAGVAIALKETAGSRINEAWRVRLPLVDPGPCAALLHGDFLLDQERHAPTFRKGGEGETRWNKEIIRQLLVPQLVLILREVCSADAPTEQSSVRLLGAMPKFSGGKSDDAETISEFFATEFYQFDWMIQVSDVLGRPLDLAKNTVRPADTKTGLIVQEVDDVLGPYAEILPAAENQRPVRYVSATVFDAIRARFPNANWCRAAEKIDSGSILKVLTDSRAVHQQENFDVLVRRLSGGDALSLETLRGALLLWSDGRPVEFQPSCLYVVKTNAETGAFHEIIETLGLKIEGLVRVDQGVGAGDPMIAAKLGLTNILSPGDETLLRLLGRVHPGENRHDTFGPEELANGTPQFQKLLTTLAQESPNRLEKMALAWTVCTDGESQVDALNEVVVIHTEHADGATQVLWDSFLSEVCPRIHRRLLNFHATLQSCFNNPVQSFDSGDVRLVRTKPEEIINWLGKLFWQRGDIRRQRQVVAALGEAISILERGGAGMGADSIIQACHRYKFPSYEFNLLCCLPVHRSAAGKRIALGDPDRSFEDQASRKVNVQRRFRLQPRDSVQPPPGVAQDFELLNPPDEVRSFYEKELGIHTHTGRLALLDLLKLMTTEEDVDRDLHKQRLQYLAAYLPQVEFSGEEQEKRELDESRRTARLVPCVGGYRTSSDALDVADALEALQEGGWTKHHEAELLVKILAKPKDVACCTDEEQQYLEVLRSRPSLIRREELASMALVSANLDLGIEDRIRLLAAFHHFLPVLAPQAASCIGAMQVPLLTGGATSFAPAELLPVDCYGLSAPIVGQFFSNAIDVAELARKTSVEDDHIRKIILPRLGKEQLQQPSAARRIREHLGSVWDKLGMAERLELFVGNERWGFTSNHLFEIAFLSLEDVSADGIALQLYGQFVELAQRVNLEKLDQDLLAQQVVFPCRDGKFHTADKCWFSTDLGLDVEFDRGAEFVVEATKDAERLRKLLVPNESKQYDLEELFPARLESPPVELHAAEPPAIHAWRELAGLVGNEGTELGSGVRHEFPSGIFCWEVRVATEMHVEYSVACGEVRPSVTWVGPTAVADRATGILWIRRSDALRSVTSSGISQLDMRIVRELLLGIGVQRGSAYLNWSKKLLGTLKRPESELKQLEDERTQSLFTIYHDTCSDSEFDEKLSRWKVLSEKSSERVVIGEWLRSRAGSGMIKERQRQMGNVGYTPLCLFAEMAQNAEDALIQRTAVGLGAPLSRALSINLMGDELCFEHYGRPFNFWRNGEIEVKAYQNDVRNIVGGTRSSKRHDVGDEVTGRFGVGFKCVYWFTDRPRIHSHLWHFEIECTCIPRPCNRPESLPSDATRIVLPLREESDTLQWPPARETLRLLLFTRELDAIRLERNGATCEINRESRASFGGSAEHVIFHQNDEELVQGIRIVNGKHQLFFHLDSEGFPVTQDHEEPDTFHTFPLLGQRHGMGISVSAAFLLQSGRGHLAPAENLGNELQFKQLGSLLASSGRALRCFAQSVSQERLAHWFTQFWKCWCFRSEADSGLEGLRLALAKALRALASTEPFIPRWDGQCRPASEDYPLTAFEHEVPESFSRNLADALHRDGRSSPSLPASAMYIADGNLVRQLDAMCGEADEPGFARWLGWEILSELFQGEGSMFGCFPFLLDSLAESLRMSGDNWDESRRPAAIKLLNASWLPTQSEGCRPTVEIADAVWLRKHGVPEYVLGGYSTLSDQIGELALDLLAGVTFKRTLTFEEFRLHLGSCPSEDDAKALLTFLAEVGDWSRWGDDVAIELRTREWVPSAHGRLSLTEPGTKPIWESLSLDFLEWLGLVSRESIFEAANQPQPSPRPPTHDPREVMEAICDWWRRERDTLLPDYIGSVYPENPPPELVWDPGEPLELRRPWVTLFVLAMSQTLGWTTAGKQREIARRLTERGFMDVLSSFESTGEDWIGMLDDHLLGRFDQTSGFSHWLQLFWRIRSIANPDWFDVIVDCLEDASREGADGMHPRAFLNPRQSVIGQGRDDVPSPARALGIGSCFLFRELQRRGLLPHESFEPFCFVPKASVRQLVSRICLSTVEYHGDPFATSRSISDILDRILGRHETFDGSFDIPLLLLSENTPASRNNREQAFGRIAPHLVGFTSIEAEGSDVGGGEWDGFRDVVQPTSPAIDEGWRTLSDGRRINLNW